jgi:hypothetical protein
VDGFDSPRRGEVAANGFDDHPPARATSRAQLVHDRRNMPADAEVGQRLFRVAQRGAEPVERAGSR